MNDDNPQERLIADRIVRQGALRGKKVTEIGRGEKKGTSCLRGRLEVSSEATSITGPSLCDGTHTHFLTRIGDDIQSGKKLGKTAVRDPRFANSTGCLTFCSEDGKSKLPLERRRKS